MKAILVNDDRSLRWDNVPDSEIKSEEVRVEIRAAAHDILYKGQNVGKVVLTLER